MTDEPALADIRALARRLAHLNAPSTDEQALLGFAVGAAYSLEHAVRLGYTGHAPAPSYSEEIRAAADAVAEGRAPHDGAWLAGYYFNSSLLRLAALGERIGKYVSGHRWDPAPAVRRDVNHMKHDIDVLLKEGREAAPDDARRALRDIVAALELLFLRFREKP